MANIATRTQVESRPVFRLLSDDGGETNAIGNYANNPTTFSAGPQLNEDWRIFKIFVMLEAVGSRELGDYANRDPLENGVDFFIRSSATDHPFGPSIKDNGDLVTIGDDAEITLFGAGGYTIHTISIVQFTDGILLRGARQDFFGVSLADDFTSLRKHRFRISGATQGII